MKESEWVSQIESHPIHGELKRLEQMLELSQTKLADEAESVMAHHRILSFKSYLVRLLKSIDSNVVPVTTLNNLNARMPPITNEVKAFTGNGNPQHLQNAASNVDNALSVLAPFPPVPADGDLGDTQEIVASLRRSVGQHLRHVGNEANSVSLELVRVRERLAENQEEIKSQKARLDQAIAEFQDQFRRAEQERTEQHNANREKRLEGFISEESARAQEYTERFEKWEETLSQTMEHQQGSLDAILAESKAAATETVTAAQEQGAGLVDTLTKFKDQAEELVNVVARTGMAAGYQEVADQEAKRAWWWHLVGVVSVLGLVGFAIVAFVVTLEPKVEWSVFGARIFVAASFALLATYAERQANRHRETERRNRRWQLVLSSVNPYLVDLPEDKQQAVKQLVAERIFASPEKTAEEGEDAVTTGMIFGLLKTVLQNLSKK